METAICTLYEKQYHIGVAALTNSLYNKGFRGNIYIGYRGNLPPWAAQATPTNIEWNGAHLYQAATGLALYFLPLQTDYHLTNYKPDFMLRLWEGPARQANSLFYFDPDIVVTGPWSYFQTWTASGVALSEDINSPIPAFHPKRIAWRTFYGERNIRLTFKTDGYANGGFIGLRKKDRSFLTTWKEVQECMAVAIGGLNRSAFKGEELPEVMKGPFSPFNKTDQDALNVTIEAWDEGIVSLIGKSAMGFSNNGFVLMPHALGQPKPWTKDFVALIPQGKVPTYADKAFWMQCASPIRVYSPARISFKKFLIGLASFSGRFYKKN